MKAWNKMDIKEQKEIFAQFLASEIAQSLDAGLEFKANMLEMAQNNPQMLAMLQQTLNKGAEQQKHDNYFANDEAAPTQSKGRGR
ncbi:hypothetical protein BB429_07850 [Helicobacter pylori]|uniref:hypothetical protein n=1 Tax=Helicobacter pylori TaxID=210 RepID=UPI000BEA3CB5|nr:hypothetical protein [Helicobacter pylori]PDW44032.1 hypothetical protein BB429_07850 [Helicobacter pylori]